MTATGFFWVLTGALICAVCIAICLSLLGYRTGVN